MTPELSFKFAHDIRTYLRTVVTRIQLVQASGGALLPEEDQSMLREAVSAARDIDGLLSAMVAYEEGKGEEGAVDMGLLLRGLLMERKASLAGAEVEVANDINLPVPAALKSVLKELLNNACRFRSTQRPLHLVIAVRSVGGAIEVAVSDNGVGVDSAYLEKIFTPFFRLHPREEFPGYGLGLATCRRIVEGWGGSITAEVRAEQGLTVRVGVPLE
jgi:chemotaxis family two-component system sensor kinase Cph1